MKKLFTLLHIGIFLFNFAVDAQMKKTSNLEARISSEGILKIMAVPGSNEDNLIELKVEDEKLVINDQGRQILSKYRNVSNEKNFIPLSELSSGRIDVYGGEGDDNLLVHYTEAFAKHEWHIRYYGQGNRAGTIGDLLSFQSENAGQFRHDAINKNDGIIYLDGSTFEYFGLEPITFSGSSANVLLNDIPGISGTISLDNAGSGNTTISAAHFEATTFPSPSNSFTFNADDGDDLVNLNGVGATIPNVTIEGGDGNDVLNVNPNSISNSLTVNADDGNDYVNFNCIGTFNTAITLDGGNGVNTLDVDAQGNCVVDNGSSLVIDGLYTISYLNFSTVNITNAPGINSGNIAFVNANVSGGNTDGNSWTDAFADLQDALALANSCSNVSEIWVAAGTYYPDQGTGQTNNDLTASFGMIEGVKIYGGFAGTESLLSERNWLTNVTILSGDIQQDDTNTDGNNIAETTADIVGSNSYNVLTAYGTEAKNITSAAELSGFVVTAGNAAGIFSNSKGGGLFCDTEGTGSESSPSINNCSFSGNKASGGGAISNYVNQSTSIPSISYCSFTGNSAAFGGAIYNDGNSGTSNPSITFCSFSGNTASSAGGAIYNLSGSGNSSPHLNSCFFIGNSASNGGAIFNSATFGTCSPSINNCSFFGNSAVSAGGAIYNFVNSGISGTSLTNCILWGNTAGIALENEVSYVEIGPTYSYCNIAGSGGSGSGNWANFGTDGGNNIDSDPLYMDAANGDLHLQQCSPCIDAGTNIGAPAFDLDGNVRPYNSGIVDMGAYEYQGAAFSGSVLYVKDDASGLNDGTSWANAYTNLQDALALANSCSNVSEIWVAAGTYYPDEGDGYTDNDRSHSFIMKNNLSIYGGFEGTEDPLTFDLANRDFVVNEAILSGEIGAAGNTDNSYTVIYNYNNGLNSTAILDGFTISGGNANGGSNSNSSGGGMYNYSSSPAVANCTFSGNSASYGGGIYNYSTSPTVVNCSFTGNVGGAIYNSSSSSPTVANCSFSGNGGGAMINYDSSSPAVTNCSFIGNSRGHGGAMYSNNGCDPTVTDCTFSGNSASGQGGAMYNIHGSSAVVTNCTFSGNSAVSGGAMLNSNYSSPVMTNCMFLNNSATQNGGAMFNADYYSGMTPSVINCTFSGNSATSGSVAHNINATLTATNCILWGNSGGVIFNDGTSATNFSNSIVESGYSPCADCPNTNGDSDPLFISTSDFRLQQCSPAIDAGTNTGAPADDLDDNIRPFDATGSATVDMGAYEYQSAYNVCTTCLTSGSVVYVNDDASGDNNGKNWADAFTDLQDALALANSCPSVTEIWVAAGTYYPDEGVGYTDNDRTHSFIIKNNLAIYGGFVGNETPAYDLSLRDFATNTSILSGEIGAAGNADNSYHVVFNDNNGLNSTAILDGFTITGGNADSAIPNDDPNENGGGMSNVSSSPTVNNCIFSGNWALQNGGGMYNMLSSPIVTNCSFNGNQVFDDVPTGGAGMCNISSSPTVSDCIFTGNIAENRGGGMANSSSSPMVTNCTFTGNTAYSGGGIYNETNSSPTVTDCEFTGNIASGGGMYNVSYSSPNVSNCTFTENAAGSGGGGGGILNHAHSSPNLTNCAFSGNSASEGGGMYNVALSAPTITNCLFLTNSATQKGGAVRNDDFYGGGNPVFINCTFSDNSAPSGSVAYNINSSFTAKNCILWGNSGGLIFNDATSTSNFTNSIVQGGYSPCTDCPNTNGDSDPLFVDQAGEDFGLQTCSPAIDAGNDAANTTTTDLDGNNRKFEAIPGGPVIDMGAYERQTLAAVPILYVKENAAGNNNGTSWTDAFTDLQSALASTCPGVTEIWVAAGTYKPTTSTDRSISFIMKNNLAIYGGFVGNETPAYDLSLRDFATNTSILSGEIGAAGNADNSYHIIFNNNNGLNSTAILDGFTITGGNADGSYPNYSGGGMYNYSSSPTVANCLFSGNSAGSGGGGMYNNEHSSPAVSDCAFSGNSAGSGGGGMFNSEYSSPAVTNCTFSGNSSSSGGGIYNSYSSPNLTNCTFSSNSGSYGGGINNSGSSPAVTNCSFTANSGGAMINYSGSSPAVTNCSFIGNTGSSGGAMYNNSCSPTVIDCTFSGNTASSQGGGMYNIYGSNAVVTNCTFSGNSAPGGGGMFNSDLSSPVMTNCLFLNNSATQKGGAMLNSDYYGGMTLSAINCTFSGNSAPSGSVVYNISTTLTATNCILWSNSGGLIFNDGISATNFANSIVEGGYTPCINCPGGDGNVDPLFISTSNFHLQQCSPAIDAGTNAGAPADDLDDNIRPFNATGSATVDMGAYEYQSTYDLCAVCLTNGNIVYVNENATGNNNGKTWTDAFNDLQNALAVANTCSDITEIWVAAGTYKPTTGTDRNVSFIMKNNLAIYGGFNGNETLLSQQDWIANPTILSGDINQSSDLFGNSYSVVTGSGTDATAVIDGFTITGGNADFTSGSFGPNRTGSGMYNNVGSPTVANCNFLGNLANWGGGMFNESSSPLVTNCTFSMNIANTSGGGMINFSSSPTVMNCTFSENSAAHGGAIFNQSSSPTVTNSVFSGNSANGEGGGGMYNNTSNPMVTNCTFSGNTAPSGGGMFNFSNSSPTVTNSIIWNNSAGESTSSTAASVFNLNSSTPTFRHSLIANSGGSVSWNGDIGTNDGNNIDSDPLFVDAANGDLHLQQCSPAIESGNNTGAPADDLDGNVRPYNSGIVDMGAYEYQGSGTVIINGIVYVNANVVGGNSDGSSWTDAFTDLQDALDLANSCSSVTQIWVAAGTYYPTTSNDRTISFVMKNDVAIYGGFNGTETLLSQRNLVVNITTLSGDIGTVNDDSDNSYHVLFNDNNGLTGSAVLDGFTITEGNANGSNPNERGGGMYNYDSSPTVSNCSFNVNLADFAGGGMFNYYSSPVVTNCSFFENSAGFGGGMFNVYSTPSVTNCSFSSNSGVTYGGGGMHNDLCSPTVTNCIFWGNTNVGSNNIAGAGIQNSGGSPIVTYCLTQENSTYTSGTGIINNQDPLFVDAANGNLHLQHCSPAIDAGTNTGAPADDLDGNVRPYNSGIVDMGAYEYQGTYSPCCANPTAGGTIVSSQNVCPGDIPAPFTSITEPSGHTGTLEYKWQESTTGPSSGFADIANSNSPTYSPGTYTADTWYKRLARVDCESSWTGAAESNVVSISLSTGTGWTLIGNDIDGEAVGDFSGYSVSLSSDGSVVAIGAFGNDGTGSNAGHVRIYENISGTWIQIGSDIEGEAAGDNSGYSVSLSSDGSVVAIGSPYNAGNGTDAGHVRIYENLSGVWIQIGSDIDGEASGDYFGNSVSLSSDGSVVAIGAPYNSGNGVVAGHVRIYENLSGNWVQIGSDIDGEAWGDGSGCSVSLSSDGSVVAIGAYGNDGIGSNAGHVRIYENISGTWTQIGSDIDGEAIGDVSGGSVSLSSDGSVVAIGAPNNAGNGTDAGHVRIYENLAGTWTQIGSDIDGEAANDKSGHSVSLNSEGSAVAIGTPYNNGSGSNVGHVRIYENLSGTWTQIGSDIDGEFFGDGSGCSVSLSSDGLALAIGAYMNDGNGASAGHVRVLNYQQSCCTNPVDGGTIADNQIICYGTSPNSLTSTAFPSGHIGTLEYKWQQSTTSSSTGFSDIAASNSAGYSPGSLTISTWYKRLARVDCETDWIGAVESNVVAVSVYDNFTTGEIEATGETICYNGDPATIGNSTLASGGDENISYKWQKSTTSATTGFADIANATSADYDPPSGLIASTWYRRMVKDATCNLTFTASTGVWKVTVEEVAVSGTLAKSPNVADVCTGTDVSATLTAGSGGNGTDELESRTHDGASWSGWATYISGAAISTTGKTNVEIRTRRMADYCVDAGYVSVSWTTTLQPVADAGAGGNECDFDFGLDATLSIGSATGTWTKTGGSGNASFNPNANDPDATVTVDAYDVYTFTWTEVNGTCSDDDDVSVGFWEVPAAQVITGDATANEGSEHVYSVSQRADYIYTWAVPEGAIVNGQGTHQITVKWDIGIGPDPITGTVSISVSTQYCGPETDVFNVTLNPVVIDGFVTYYNQYNTPMNGVTLRLYTSPGGQQVGNSVVTVFDINTGSSGYYKFLNVADGDYYIKAEYGAWAGVNATDALAVQIEVAGGAGRLAADYSYYWWEYSTAFEPTACDVNSSGGLTSADALIIKYASLGIFPVLPNSTPNHLFGYSGGGFAVAAPTGMLGAFNPFTVANGSLTKDVVGLCMGDANASYVPLINAKSLCNLEYEGVRQVKEGEQFEIPVRLSEASEIGAVTLGLTYLGDLISIEDVVSNTGEGLVFNVEGNKLMIAWSSLNAMEATEDLPILTIVARANTAFNEGARLFQLDNMTELADANAKVIENVAIKIASFTTSEMNSELALNNYPNPFSQVTTIEFNVPEDGKVRIELYSSIGKRLEVITERDYTAGSHEVQFKVGNLSAGTYFIKLESNGQTLNKAVQVVR